MVRADAELKPPNAIVAADAHRPGRPADVIAVPDPSRSANLGNSTWRTPNSGAVQVPDAAEPLKPARDGPHRQPSGSLTPSTPEQLQRSRVRKENLDECCNICVFFTFLFFFTLTMLLEQSAASSRLADHIRAKLDRGAVPLTSVSSLSSLYDYLEQGFIPAVYEDSLDTRTARAASAALIPLDLSNRIIGAVRLRQVRVEQKSGCQVSPMFQAYSVSCYPSFNRNTRSTASYGPEQRFRHSEDSDGTGQTGHYANYGPGGYMELLPENSTLAIASLQQLRRDSFFDSATRAVFAELNIWSMNAGTYAVVSVLVEFSPTSAVNGVVDVITVNERSLIPGGLGFGNDWLAFITMIIVTLFVIWFMIEEIQEIWIYRFGYFLDGWNIIDWTNMILLLVAFGARINNFVAANDADIGQQALANKNSFVSIRSLAERTELVRLLHAFNAVLLWGKAVKYLRHFPVVKDLIRTVWEAFDLFVPFLCMFSVAFVGFVMAYSIGFGDKMAELSTFYSALVYLCRAFLRDIKLMPVYHLTPQFGAFMILLFYVTLVLVGASFLFAIVVDALFRAKHKPHVPNPLHEDEPVEEFVREVHNRFPGLFRLYEKLARLVMRRTPKRKAEAAVTSAQPGGPSTKSGISLPHARDQLAAIEGAWDVSSSIFAPAQRLPTRMELMRSIELMSGRVLSEISIVSIEIRSELHEICEQVAQMQMAVEDLANRTHQMKGEQEMVIT